MQEAIEEAHKARLIDEVPIGAVVVYKGEVIGTWATISGRRWAIPLLTQR
jgi:tRNA(Arg) A34 adenosine deaminase TadA